MKIYVYCLAGDVPAFPVSLRGILGAHVRLIDSGGFSVVVSDFAGDAVPVNRENAIAHASVVGKILQQTTPLPFRFGTIVTEQQLESYLSSRAAAVRERLELIRGCVEMSVKIISNDEPAEEPAEDAASQTTPGTAFLAEKRREILGGEARAAEADRISTWLQERIGETAKDTRVDRRLTEKLLIAVSHLVERDAVSEYRSLVRKAQEERPELHFLVSGPWAPYSFANIDLEFKTQFGVS